MRDDLRVLTRFRVFTRNRMDGHSTSGGNFRRVVNGGAHTLAAPTATGDYTLVIQYTNNGSAGPITLSGFALVTGDDFTAVNGDDFLVYIAKVNGFTHASVVALQ